MSFAIILKMAGIAIPKVNLVFAQKVSSFSGLALELNKLEDFLASFSSVTPPSYVLVCIFIYRRDKSEVSRRASFALYDYVIILTWKILQNLIAKGQ